MGVFIPGGKVDSKVRLHQQHAPLAALEVLKLRHRKFMRQTPLHTQRFCDFCRLQKSTNAALVAKAQIDEPSR
jgi:hypothetical protein